MAEPTLAKVGEPIRDGEGFLRSDWPDGVLVARDEPNRSGSAYEQFWLEEEDCDLG